MSTEIGGHHCASKHCEQDPKDSELWFTTELLQNILWWPGKFTHMSLTLSPDHGPSHHEWCLEAPAPCFAGALVKITNGEQKWIYKVDEYDMCKDAWHSRWPD